MRRFIYLDTDTLNSYLAQMFDGLIQGKSEESEDKRGIEKQNGIKTTALGELALKLWGKGVDASFEAAYERLKTVANEEMFRDVQTKIMHDNAFDHFYEYIEDENLLNCENEIGSFVAVEDNFYIFDIAFYQKLFAENGFVTSVAKITEMNAEKKIQEQFDALPREQRRDKSIKGKFDDMRREATAKTQNGFVAGKTLIEMLASIIPYPQILCIKNYLVVLNENFMRDSISTAAFKYGGKVNVVGYITNKVTAQTETPASEFAGIGNSINDIMKVFFKNVDEMYIVHPIAVYYDT